MAEEDLSGSEVERSEALLRFDPQELRKLKRKIIVALGAGRVKVELSEEQIDLAIEKLIEARKVVGFGHRNGATVEKELVHTK